jgi:PKD domain-containing protein
VTHGALGALGAGSAPLSSEHQASKDRGAVPRSGTLSDTGAHYTASSRSVGPGIEEFGWIRGSIDPLAALGDLLLTVTNQSLGGGPEPYDTATGAYNVTVLSPASWSVQVDSAGYRTYETVIETAVGLATWLNITLVQNTSVPSPSSRGWLLWSNATDPPARGWAATADDPAEGGLLLFGGFTASHDVLNDTWLFHAGRWTELCTGSSAPPSCPLSPPARYMAGMTWDAAENAVVLYSGIQGGGSSVLDDTWEFVNGSWQNDTHGESPGGTLPGPLVYDAAERYVLLFANYGWTWAFSNGTWTHLHPSHSPSPMGGEALFYDSEMGAAILWGGLNDSTWAYVDGDWDWMRALTPTVSPPAGSPAGWAYDSAGGYGVVFDPTGAEAGGLGANSTWIFQDGSWTNSSASWGAATDPPASAYLDMAYDSTDQYTVLLELGPPFGYSATNATWLLHDPMSVTSSTSAAVADAGQNLTYRVEVAGGVDPFTFTFSSMPPGCWPFASGANWTTLACAVDQAGPFEFGATATDWLGASLSTNASLTVNPPPTMRLQVGPNPTDVGLPVEFQAVVNGGTDPISGQWTIRYREQRAGLFANSTFSAPGSYPASFTAVDATGFVVTASVTIVVRSALSISAGPSQSATDAGLPVSFAVTALGGTGFLSYDWSFGDGENGSGPSVGHVYTAAGIYEPVVWVNDSAGAAATQRLAVEVNPALLLGASVNLTRPRLGQPVMFTAMVEWGTAPYSYVWRFDNGEVNTTSEAAQPFWTTGNHTATLVVNDSAGATISIQVSVDVIPLPFVVSPRVTASATPFPWSDAIPLGIAGLLIGLVIGGSAVELRHRRQRAKVDARVRAPTDRGRGS